MKQNGLSIYRSAGRLRVVSRPLTGTRSRRRVSQENGSGIIYRACHASTRYWSGESNLPAAGRARVAGGGGGRAVIFDQAATTGDGTRRR